ASGRTGPRCRSETRGAMAEPLGVPLLGLFGPQLAPAVVVATGVRRQQMSTAFTQETPSPSRVRAHPMGLVHRADRARRRRLGAGRAGVIVLVHAAVVVAVLVGVVLRHAASLRKYAAVGAFRWAA